MAQMNLDEQLYVSQSMANKRDAISRLESKFHSGSLTQEDVSDMIQCLKSDYNLLSTFFRMSGVNLIQLPFR